MSSPVTPTTIQFVQAQPFSLSGSGGSIGDTTILLQSMIGIDGNNIVTADLGSFAYGTLEPGNGTQEEAVLFTGITQNANGTATLTGVSSLSFKQPYTLTTGLTKTHAGASKFILSNDAAFYNNLVLYMNSIAGAGAANASTTVKGLVQAATSAQVNSGTPTGSTGAVLAVTPDALLASNYALASGTLAALAGSSGTPSGINKFVTQASLKFGGTGSDGVLAISSGTTTLDLGAASTFTKNYTSISITGTGKLTFTNPGTNGTIIILKSQGAVTLTSSTSPCIDATGMGSVAGTAGSGSINQTASSTAVISNQLAVVAGVLAGNSTTGALANATSFINFKSLILAPGTGGGGGGQYTGSTDGNGAGGGASIIHNGGNGTAAGGNTGGTTSGAGGRGGGALYIECAGTYTNTLATLSVAGIAGTNSGSSGSGAGGGGGAGTLYVLYNVLGSDTGTYTVSGGAGGSGVSTGNKNGGVGGAGYSSVSLNSDFT